jgi:beta-fructofuranosidase
LLSPLLTLDPQGRSVAIAIIPDETSGQAELKQGWAHLYSIPRVWELKKGKIAQSPLPELATLRQDGKSLKARKVSEILPLSRGERHVEVELSVSPPRSGKVGFNVGKSADGSEYTRIIFDYDKQQVAVDLRKSTLCDSIKGDFRVTDFRLDPNQDLDVRLFVDGSVVEVFFGDGEAFTTRMFPRNPSANLIEFFTEGGTAEIKGGNVWTLRPAEVKSDW